MAKLVIFDCDGTLVDSELLCNQGLSEQLASIGVDISGDELVQRFRGVEFDVILQALITERGLASQRTLKLIIAKR
ncbi:HAD hydrolase-like protein [Vibrio olivae]